MKESIFSRFPLASKGAALGFIGIILFGNFWVVNLSLGLETHVWIIRGFQCGVVIASISAAIMSLKVLIMIVKERI